ncbi:MAG TPA: hypothetical protein VFV34_13555, partial [Blastocatellia bacterium]|nr:hypothetical protein [Blastocatellia bacterium]
MRLSLKLGALCAGVAIVPVAAASVVVLQRVPSAQATPELSEIQASTTTALALYEKRLEQMRLAAQYLANEIGLRVLLEGSEPLGGPKLARLQDLLSRARDELSLDFVVVADKTGHVIARHNDAPAAGEMLPQSTSRNAIAGKVMADGAQLRHSPQAAVVLERGEILTRLWLDKAARVTRVDGSTLDEALIIESAAPVFSAGQFSGAVLIGQMLNNYYVARPGASLLQTPLIAEVKQTVFPGTESEGGALIVIEDTVVASSVRDPASAHPVLFGARCNTGDAPQVLTWSG